MRPILALPALLAACTPEQAAEVEVARTPAERLDAALPGLAAAVGTYTKDLDAVADIVDGADPALVRLLLPPKPGRTWQDAVGDGTTVDLSSASVTLTGTTLTGEIAGTGVVKYGARLWVDTRGGPAPDLALVFDAGGVRWAAMHGFSFSPEQALAGTASLDGERVRFSVNLAPTGLLAAGHAGAVTAIIQAGDQSDAGPAGTIGTPEPSAVATLVDLVAPAEPDARVRSSHGDLAASAVARSAVDDPSLTVAVALAYGALRPLVASTVRPTLQEDARARLDYGLRLDAWLEKQGADWRLRKWPGMEKLLWAWPAGENVIYGAMPLAWEDEPLSAAAYRFHVPSVATLVALRDGLPMAPHLDDAAQLRDDRVWAEMLYRAKDEGMKALCDAKSLDSHTCFAWESDRNAGRTFGEVDGVSIPMHQATSTELQTSRWTDEGDFLGDCTTATTVAGAAWQAIGVAPLSVGYAGPDWYWPTHNEPLYYDGAAFVATQDVPGHAWDAKEAWIYAVLPPVAGPISFGVGNERAGWARGGSIAGGVAPYGRLDSAFLDGIEAGVVTRWIEAPWSAAWPEVALP